MPIDQFAAWDKFMEAYDESLTPDEALKRYKKQLDKQELADLERDERRDRREAQKKA